MRTIRILSPGIAGIVLLVLAACGKPEVVTLDNGLMIQDKVIGKGAVVEKLDLVTVDYTGRLADGTVFDSSHNPGRSPFRFTLGVGMVIDGWEEGIPGMRVGGKRILTVPPELGYGKQGAGKTIPP
ncbi:MAG: hypothetical protein GXO92_06260, partial [FCB group bacterium]|nr:hypothetical protein [FCB group bacterium]